MGEYWIEFYERSYDGWNRLGKWRYDNRRNWFIIDKYDYIDKRIFKFIPDIKEAIRNRKNEIDKGDFIITIVKRSKM